MAINITRGLDRLLGFVLLSLTLFILLTTKAAAGAIVYFEASGNYQGGVYARLTGTTERTPAK